MATVGPDDKSPLSMFKVLTSANIKDDLGCHEKCEQIWKRIART